MAQQGEIKSLKKALAAIAFMNERGDTTATQLGTGIGVPRATAYRILQTLASESYVEKVPGCDLYRLTSLVRRLAEGFRDEDLLIEIARPLLTQLQREIGWTVSLIQRRGTDMVVRLNTDHDSPLALVRYGVGATLPLLFSTGGYAYLANCRPPEQESLIQACLESPPPSLPSGFDRARVDALIEGVVTNGFCNLEFDNFREGNLGVALLLAGRPVGAIVMRYIKSTLHGTDRLRQEYAPRLQQVAAEIALQHPSHQTWLAEFQPMNTPA